MATISSAGIGSGLDVSSIVSQLVALEKRPLTALAQKATQVQTKLSAFGTVQSQVAALTDVATRISSSTAWSARTATSSNTSAATVTATSSAGATSFTLDVDVLAPKGRHAQGGSDRHVTKHKQRNKALEIVFDPASHK